MRSRKWKKQRRRKEVRGEQGCLENCRLALEAYSNALQIYSLEEFPRLYATAQNNLANVYLTQGQRVDKTVNCMKAIMAAQKALSVFSLEDSPEDYGEAKGSLWLAYLTLTDIEYRAENCALALQACEERLHSYRAWEAPAAASRFLLQGSGHDGHNAGGYGNIGRGQSRRLQEGHLCRS